MMRRPSGILALVSWLALACNDPYGGSASATSSSPPSAPTTPPERPHAAPEAGATVLPIVPDDPKAGNVHYVEVLLGGAKADDALPMIVAIHGLGDDPRNFAHLFDSFTERARLILPRGLQPSDGGGGWSWFPGRARDPDVEAFSQGLGSAADELARSIELLARERKTLGKPIVTGFSQGGMLSFAIAVRHPEVVALALPVGGWLPGPLVPSEHAPKQAPPVRAFHGTDDPAVRLAPTAASVDALKQHGWDVELREYAGVGHVITPEILRDLTDRIVDAVRASKPARKAG
ncbi:MAG: alpha/beta fold hydrolase [Deltaproteobacteria bacterium]|nr:alpha/beta fold hydrolase [Nannocystaceae bacterium]